jgi:hypothetical protein
MPAHRRPVLPVVLIAAAGLVVGLAVPAAARETGTLINGKSIAKLSTPGNRLENNTVTGREVRESTLGVVPRAKRAVVATTAVKVPAPPIDRLTLATGWSEFSTGTRAASYSVDAQGYVHLEGIIDALTGSTVEPFVMPVGARPDATINEPIEEEGGYVGRITISATGVAVIYNAPGAPQNNDLKYTSLEGVTYPTR